MTDEGDRNDEQTVRRELLLRSLRGLGSWGKSADPESDHVEADRLLLAYIDDEEVTEAFEAVHKWYA